MKITADFSGLNRGETSGVIRVQLSEMHRDKKVRLCFLTPLGQVYFTDYLTISDGRGEYTLPEALTEVHGELCCQLFLIREGDSYLLKSPVHRFLLRRSVGGRNKNIPGFTPGTGDNGLTKGEKKYADFTGLHLCLLR